MLPHEESLNVLTEFLLEHGYNKACLARQSSATVRLVLSEMFTYEKKFYRQVTAAMFCIHTTLKCVMSGEENDSSTVRCTNHVGKVFPIHSLLFHNLMRSFCFCFQIHLLHLHLNESLDRSICLSNVQSVYIRTPLSVSGIQCLSGCSNEKALSTPFITASS